MSTRLASKVLAASRKQLVRGVGHLTYLESEKTLADGIVYTLQALAKSTVVIADDVAATVGEFDRQGKPQRPHSFRPSLRNLFIEYEITSECAPLPFISPNGQPLQQFGVLIVSTPRENAIANLRYDPDVRYSGLFDDVIAADDADEVLIAFSFYSAGGCAFATNTGCFVLTDRDGQQVKTIDLSIGREHPPETWFRVPEMTLSLLSCKNVAPIDVTATHGPSEAWCRRQKVPRLSYRVLNVNPLAPRRQCDSDGEAAGDTQPRPLSLMRGHFKHFTPERPLFGKYSGSFWWQQHVRGDAKAGVSLHDYRLRSPQTVGV